MTLGLTIASINWRLLREQKQWLLQNITDAEEDKLGLGLLHLIDAIQDSVVEDGFASAEQVFGNTKED